jgi:hypothetical protein
MTRRVVRIALFLIILALVVTAVSVGIRRFTHDPYAEGRAEALHDVAAGRLILKTAGLPTAEHDELVRILAEEFGIEVQGVAGCIVTDDVAEYLRGYAPVAQAEILRIHGRDILPEAQVEARRRWETRRTPEAPMPAGKVGEAFSPAPD